MLDDGGEWQAAILYCGQCGDALGDDLDDDPMGDRVGPLCGECARTRDFEAELESMDSADGSIDSDMDW